MTEKTRKQLEDAWHAKLRKGAKIEVQWPGLLPPEVLAMINAAARSKKARRALGTMVAVGFVNDQLNALMSEEDETGIKEYDRQPEWKLEHNLLIRNPAGDGNR